MNVLKSKHLKKIYPNGVEAVKDLSISVREGEILGFLGPNGAGKSTSINMFVGLLNPTDGELEVLGYEIPKEQEKLRGKIGYVPQQLVFYDHLTVLENLTLFAKCYEIPDAKSKINELLELFELMDLKSRRSHNLSGGQKRRLNVAIGLLNSPELLILDEPSAGMDPQSRNVLWRTIEKFKGDMTIILTTHLMETADRLSDRIAIVDEGKLLTIDTPEGLKRKYSTDEIIDVYFQNGVNKVSLFKKLDDLPNVEYFDLPDRISIKVENALDALPQLIDIMNTTIGRDQVKSISIRSNTLEDVFISLTGKSLKEVQK